MCPISSLTQFLLIVCTLALCAKATLSNNSEWNISCEPQNLTIYMYQNVNITCDIKGPEKAYSEHMLIAHSQNPELVRVKTSEIWLKKEKDSLYFPETFILEGVFIGQTNVSVQIRRRNDVVPQAEENIPVIISRKFTAIDTAFHVSVIFLVTLMYINFGCAFNWGELRENMRRPISPLMGLAIQIIIMPLMGFILGRIIFPNNVHLQLGLFFSGIVPSGGASNMWTLLLEGNLDLSITMTTMSTLGAFITMPFWVFTLGHVIYSKGEMEVPYVRIMQFSVCLIVPLCIGYLVQRFLPKVSHFLVRILKGLSLGLLIFIILFAIITQSYIFKLFSWQVILGGIGLPWCGYIIAYVMARILRRSNVDSFTIAIETGIQNTGIAIGLLKSTLGQPAGDIAMVVPIAVAVMTPFPLLGAYFYKLVRKRMDRNTMSVNGKTDVN